MLLAPIDALPRGGPCPVSGVELRVALGGHATRFTAVLDGRVVGLYEVASDLTEGGTLSRLAGWAEGWELFVEPELRCRGLATRLIGHAADRLRLGSTLRVLDQAVIAPAGQVDGEGSFRHATGRGAALALDPDNSFCGPGVLYQWCRDGVLAAPPITAGLGATVTARNRNTVTKLAEYL